MKIFSLASQKEMFNEPFALVTITGYIGTVPRKEGRMIVSKEGKIYGTIGGGEHEEKARLEAVKRIETGIGGEEKIRVNNSGEITVMIDIPLCDRSIVIIGSGHVGKAIYELMYSLTWYVTVLDEREDLLNEENYPYAERVITHDISSSLKEIDINHNSAIVVTSPEVASAIIDSLLSTDAFYIGVLSSRKKTPIKVRDKRVYSPMGLDIGAVTPEEIALSVSSEIMKVFNKKNGRENIEWRRKLVVVRGAGDLATGTIVRLHNAGYNVIATETDRPTSIRRTVSFSEAVYNKEQIVEGVKAVLVSSLSEAYLELDKGNVPLFIDKEGKIIEEAKPNIVVDAIMAKKNLGTRRDAAPFVVALGPGFTAGEDVDVVIETMRGHTLGSIIREGSAIPNTGIPGLIGGYGKERVIHTPCEGVFKEVKHIGDIVKKDEVIAYCGEIPVLASISGKLRGILPSGLFVPSSFKAADIDPRGEETDHTTLSDKAKAIAGGVLEAIDNYLNN